MRKINQSKSSADVWITFPYLQRIALIWHWRFSSFCSFQGEIIPFVANSTMNRTVCTSCLTHYTDLNKYYELIDNKFNHKLCMDIVDAVSIDTIYCISYNMLSSNSVIIRQCARNYLLKFLFITSSVFLILWRYNVILIGIH